MQKRDKQKKEENKGQEVRKGVSSFTLSFLFLAYKDENRMGDIPPHSLPEVKWSRKCVKPTLANV